MDLDGKIAGVTNYVSKFNARRRMAECEGALGRSGGEERVL